MTIDERILERLDHIESQIAPLATSARAMAELKEEMAPRVNEAVHALIRELADVESDFQIEDLLFFIKKLMRNVNNLNFSLDQLKNLIDFAVTAEPLMKATVPQAILYLDDLEKKGIFRLAIAALEFATRVGQQFSSEELRQMVDGLVRYVGILKKLTESAVVDLVERAAEVPSRLDFNKEEPTSLKTIFKSLTQKETLEGAGVLVELTKALGSLKS
jgi:uncharacterized protein YjgD (DUF1641 family)